MSEGYELVEATLYVDSFDLPSETLDELRALVLSYFVEIRDLRATLG